MSEIFLYILLGLTAGVLSGLVGIGGGILIVPSLVLLFGMTQHQAQGTSLAVLIPPVGILAAMTYYKQGMIDLRVAGLICAGFVVGALFGAKISISLSDAVMKKVFGAVLFLISLKMLFNK
ncbi:MAG: TSUP family transporter [Syntrophomonadaceae bacterium]